MPTTTTKEWTPAVGERVCLPDGEEGEIYHVADDGLSFTVKRDDGKSGSGVVIEEAPYHGGTGWIIKKDSRLASGWTGGCRPVKTKPIKLPFPMKALQITQDFAKPVPSFLRLVGAYKQLKKTGAAKLILKDKNQKLLVKPKSAAEPRSFLNVYLPGGKVFANILCVGSPKERLTKIKNAAAKLLMELRNHRETLKDKPKKAANYLETLRKRLVKKRRDDVVSGKSPTDFDRYVGVEMEFLTPRELKEDVLIDALAAAKLHLNVHLHGDGSVSGNGLVGREISVLAREKDIADVIERTTCVLRGAGQAVVNTTCGLHVHLDMRHVSAAQFAEIHGRFVMAHKHLVKMLPASRRENRYCQMNSSNAPDFHERYKMVNACAYPKYKTIEIRSHSGTLEAEKVVNWINILKAIRDAAPRQRMPRHFQAMLKWLKLPKALCAYIEARVREFSAPTPVPSATPTASPRYGYPPDWYGVTATRQLESGDWEAQVYRLDGSMSPGQFYGVRQGSWNHAASLVEIGDGYMVMLGRGERGERFRINVDQRPIEARSAEGVSHV